jgi:hypothetical protein
MIQRMMVRSFLVTLVGLSLLAAPAFAAGPAQPADSPRSGWMVELGDLLSRAWGLLLVDGTDGWGSRDRGSERESAGGVDQVSGADESDSGSSMDPDG